MCVLILSVVSNSLRPHGLHHTRLLCTWNFPKQGFWSGLPILPPGELPDPGIEPASPASPALASGFCITESPGKPIHIVPC